MLVLRNFSLEDYETFDDDRLRKLTDAQKRMILEDERKKAKRNIGKIIKEEGDRGAAEGKKRGKRRGAITGAIGGALLGGAIGSYNPVSEEINIGKGSAIGALAGAGVLGGLGYLTGGSAGAREGRIKAAKEGYKKALEQGHGEVDVMTRHARTFDDYARKHRKKDHWEIDLRDQLKAEKEAAAEAAKAKRAESFERRRVEAEERAVRAREREADARYREADARYRDSLTNRDRYLDEGGKRYRSEDYIW